MINAMPLSATRGRNYTIHIPYYLYLFKLLLRNVDAPHKHWDASLVQDPPTGCSRNQPLAL